MISGSLHFFRLLISVFTLGLALWCGEAYATIRIPQNLNKEDRQTAVRILGFGTSSKILSDPFPLGGYSGFEFGISLVDLPIEDIGRLGDKLSAPQRNAAYPLFSIGKGLYNNLDFFIQFIPYTQGTEISQYGGIIRWGFYQAAFLPATLSVLLHGNSTNISNRLITRTLGADLIAGINVDSFALYFGGGPLQADGRFLGGADGVTLSGAQESERVNVFHMVVGATVHMGSTFLSAQIDRYTEPVYSFKIGLRF